MADKTTHQPASPAPGKPNGLTKMDAVRTALAQLGKSAKPLKIQEFVKAQFGVEMSTEHISNCKGEILRRKSGAKKQARKPAPAAASTKAAAAGKGPRAAITMADIQALKGLVGRVGPSQLKALVDLLAD
jgi:hypothetical protein